MFFLIPFSFLNNRDHAGCGKLKGQQNEELLSRHLASCIWFCFGPFRWNRRKQLPLRPQNQYKALPLIMKTTIVLITACVFCLGVSAKGSHVSSGHVNSSSHGVSGYTTKNGTYVAPSHATNPNTTKTDNFSQNGNVNPYTGKAGTKD